MTARRTGTPRTALAALAALAALGSLALGGCASAEEDAAPSDAAPAATAAAPGATPGGSGARSEAPSEVREIAVAVRDGEVQPPPDRVALALGETVRLTVTSDVVDELHVHGFGDPELALEPGVPGTLELTADATGSYEVETHESGLVLLTLDVR